MSNADPCRFPSEYQDLLKSQKYSDLTIICQGRQWRAHRAIICPRSKFFAALCDGSFQEATSGVVNIEEEHPAIVERVLLYLYTLDYNDERGAVDCDEPAVSPPVLQHPDNISETAWLIQRHVFKNKPFDLGSCRVQESLMINARVYAMADRLDIPELRKVAQTKFEHRIAAPALKIYGPPAAFAKVIETTQDNDQGLRAFVLDQCVNAMKRSLCGRNKEVWECLLRGDVDFTVQVLQRTVRAYNESLKSKDDQYKTTDAQLTAERLKSNALQKAVDDHRRGVAELVTAINKGTCSVCHSSLHPLLGPSSSATSKSGFALQCRKCTATLVS